MVQSLFPVLYILSCKWLPLTGRLQCHLEQIEDITRLARQCQLNELINELQENRKQVLSFGDCFILCVMVLFWCLLWCCSVCSGVVVVF